jgi:hypothetical protein
MNQAYTLLMNFANHYYRLFKPLWTLSYGHLPETPSHDSLQKVVGFVDGLTGLWGEMTTTTIEKYSHANG